MPLGRLRDRVLFETIYRCGTRAAAACVLDVEDFDLRTPRSSSASNTVSISDHRSRSVVIYYAEGLTGSQATVGRPAHLHLPRRSRPRHQRRRASAEYSRTGSRAGRSQPPTSHGRRTSRPAAR
ncbi:tyrosine-type recombinase/integrase [Nonomuraea dietziae]